MNFCSLAVEVYFHTVFKPLFCETIGMFDISIVLFNSHFFVPFLLFFILFSSVLFVSQIFFTLHHFYLLSVIVCPFLSPFEVIVCFLLLTQIWPIRVHHSINCFVIQSQSHFPSLEQMTSHCLLFHSSSLSGAHD